MLARLYLMSFFFFFFQAEDGIRDVAVTGVQTCALPISDLPDLLLGIPRARAVAGEGPTRGKVALDLGLGVVEGLVRLHDRSEERRVGKECMWRCAAEQLYKKEEDDRR